MFSKIVLGLLFIIGGSAAALSQTQTQPETGVDRTDSHADKTSTMATVYVYRSLGKETNAKDKVPVYYDGKEVASVAGGRFFAIYVEPGKHALSVGSATAAPLTLDYKRSQEYYLRVGNAPKAGVAVVKFEEGSPQIRQLTPIEDADVKDKDLVSTRTPQ